MNRASQAADLLDRIDRPGIVVGHLDTFHMNLAEPDIREAVRWGLVQHARKNSHLPLAAGPIPPDP